MITSGGYKDEVIKKFMTYKCIPEIKEKFLSIIIFCANVEYHGDAMEDPHHGKYIYDVISDISLLVPTLNDLIQ